ncbi:MAG: hypothetical protein WBH31_07365 [Promethearchaeia archaeon]
MEKKNVGNRLIIGGSLTFIIGSLLWIILFLLFTIVSGGFFLGLIILPTSNGLLCIIIGCVINEKRRKMDILPRKAGVAFVILGLYILFSLLLIDSPIGPPILGTANMNVDMGNGLYFVFMLGPVFILILSGLELSLISSKRWLVIGLIVLVISVGVFQSWLNIILTGYMKMMDGPPGPL